MDGSFKAQDLEKAGYVDADEGPVWTQNLWSRDFSGSTIEPLSSDPAWSRNVSADDTVLPNDLTMDDEVVRTSSPAQPRLTPSGARCRSSSLPSSIRFSGLGDETNRDRARNRMLTRAGLGIYEHLAERVAERSLEHIFERGAEHTAEVIVKRQSRRLGHVMETVSRSLKRNSEKFERSAGSTLQRLMEGTSERGLITSIDAQAERRNELTILSLRLTVTLVGMLLVLHMAHSDLHRAQAERASGKASRAAYRMFLLAMLMDGIDFMVHVMVLADLAAFSIDGQVLHSAESLGFWCAVVGTLALILGELWSAPSQRAVQAHVTACTAKQE